MAHIHTNHHVISVSRRFQLITTNPPNPVRTTATLRNRRKSFKIAGYGGGALVKQRPLTNDEDAPADMIDQTADDDGDGKGMVVMDECLVREYGWQVRRMVEDKSEMRKVADIQAHAFHVPSFFFDDWLFHLFQAEVLAGLLYRLRNSPPDRYACLVAEPTKDETAPTPQPQEQQQKLVGVVDVTVLRDYDVLRHLEGAKEYLYVSGIAVANDYRRQKVATVLLKACEVISVLWGHEYLVLRAYEDDKGARALYTNVGYRLVSGDPPWVTWIGRKRRILMMKRL